MGGKTKTRFNAGESRGGYVEFYIAVVVVALAAAASAYIYTSTATDVTSEQGQFSVPDSEAVLNATVTAAATAEVAVTETKRILDEERAALAFALASTSLVILSAVVGPSSQPRTLEIKE